VNSGQDTDTQSTGLHNLLTLILWIFGCGETPEDFGVFSTDQWLRGITATGRKCLSGDSNKTRSFWKSGHLCAMKS
jgi:hypothetical protein